jgi:hypothetical protein
MKETHINGNLDDDNDYAPWYIAGREDILKCFDDALEEYGLELEYVSQCDDGYRFKIVPRGDLEHFVWLGRKHGQTKETADLGSWRLL